MLFWEALHTSLKGLESKSGNHNSLAHRTPRLPFDKRCGALTKTGTRCRGRIRKGSEFCPFHDPAVIAERRQPAAKHRPSHRRLTRLPNGYLRKLTDLTSIGQAMDRLYREVRLGIVTVEMGRVLFNILTRLMEADWIKTGSHPHRSKAVRMKPKLADLLTRQERAAWRKAVEQAPQSLIRPDEPSRAVVPFDRQASASTPPRKRTKQTAAPAAFVSAG